jgi:glycosyltransferase involved in cell wall biosynthesis
MAGQEVHLLGVEGLAHAPLADGANVELVSVVICTAGRRATLWALIERLAELDDPACEVIVVENARQPTLPAARVASLGVRHLVERQVGLDAARNRGAREAKGDIVAYVDDDCQVEPGWLAGVRRGFADPSVALVTGRVLPVSLGLPSEQLFESWCAWDRGRIPTRFTASDDLPSFPASSHHLGTGCNMAFRRDVLLGLGGFDEALDMGSLIGGGGDLDAFCRVLDAGHAAAYEPTALVRHLHRQTLHDLRWQVWGYGLSQGALLAKGFVTRPGLRLDIARFGRYRLRRKVLQLLGRIDAEVPRRILLVEVLGILAGPIAYLPSRIQAWVRRQRR